MLPILITLALIVALLVFFWYGGRGSDHEPTVHRQPHDGIDRAELERAEHEARDAADEDRMRDWGPGAGRGGMGAGEG
ncbi:MAG: hypothetical protein ACREMV_08730 [Gemmatimonadales bacterium]